MVCACVCVHMGFSWKTLRSAADPYVEVIRPAGVMWVT